MRWTPVRNRSRPARSAPQSMRHRIQRDIDADCITAGRELQEELALFDMLLKENISKADRERVKQASKGLLASLNEHLASMPNWTKNATTQADVQMFILDNLYASLPRPPFTDEEAESLAQRLYGFVHQKSERGELMAV